MGPSEERSFVVCFAPVIASRKTCLCSRCQKKVDREAYNDENVMLPSWINSNGEPQYHVPPELQNLTVAEVLLIQRVSPLVPLVHIKNGTLGLKGHVCSFLQEVNEVATKLPRLPTEIKTVKMVRSFKDARGHPGPLQYRSASSRVVRDDVRFPDFLSLAGRGPAPPVLLCRQGTKQPNPSTT